MIPREARRGSSFVGCGKYYLHDKAANTSERVEFTHTVNVPTNDPQKAMKWMAWTAINAEELKRESGGSLSGRSCKKPVYTFSLSWHPEQDPKKWNMIGAGRQALIALGLAEHETVMVSHNDCSYKHLHVIVNLVHPETGKANSVSFSRKRLSAWAEQYEQTQGKIYCDQRVANNAKRAEGEFVKYEEPSHDLKTRISKLYAAAETGKAFHDALEAEGFRLAQGKRIVLIDPNGKIHSLSRQIDGVTARDLREKLAQLDLSDIEQVREAMAASNDASRAEQNAHDPEPSPNAASATSATANANDNRAEPHSGNEQTDDDRKSTKADSKNDPENTKKQSSTRPPAPKHKHSAAETPLFDDDDYSDRERQESEWQESIIDAALRADHTKRKVPAKRRSQHERKPAPESKQQQAGPVRINNLQDRQLDELGRFYSESTHARLRLESQLNEHYGESERQIREELRKLESTLQNSWKVRIWWLKVSGQIPKNAEEEVENLRKNVENIEWRRTESINALENEIRANRAAVEIRHRQERESLAEVHPTPAFEPVELHDPTEEIDPFEDYGPSY